ncbi:M20/M25/M40 family metallo-hydrolase [Sphingomonas sp.]|uniref:M20/M25/M40 family metallo-hydrolase n=1 Tax=Sphingomonas sp. TaxID=28214 RepID=UPI00286E4701|nr:M20/M25/M40 family metallo-hydrolase [Sphingomonas sp.]
MRRVFSAVLLAATVTSPVQAAEPLRPDQVAFRALYEELVETNTTLSEGSCTLAAERMAARLRAAGMADSQLTLFADPAHPKEGGLVAVYPGTSATLRPILLLAHIDVVEAKREDWTRDPFTLVEEGGYFYARGSADDKAMAAVWVDALVRFKQQNYRPKRTIKVALTCGEETNGAFNGAEWLTKNRRELIDAEFALNEGGGGDSDGKGKLVGQSIQVGEKTFANFRLETRNPGGHSSVPVRANAIYQLARALTKIDEHEFPAEMTEVTRSFFARSGAGRNNELGRAMVALAANLNDKAAEAVVNKDPFLHSNLRTTCVATMLDGGHAKNALPQRAGANVNCRIFPTHTIEETQAELARVIGDPGVTIEALPPVRPSPPAPPLDAKIVAPMERLAKRYFPGIPLIPSMANGYTDATFLAAAGIPTYGVPGMWGDPDGNGAHGLNERMEVRSVYVGRDYLVDLVKAYAD